jgi:DNA polymerase-3 subunit delta
VTKYEDLMRSLRKGTVLPVYLFFGDEPYLIQEAVDLLIKLTVDVASRDFNFNSIYCKATPVSEILTLCQTVPFMAEWRLVVAREVEALKAADLGTLAAYLEDPSPSTCLVLIADQARYEKKTVVSGVEKHGAAVRFFPLLDREMAPWIDAWMRKRGRSIGRDAAQYVWQTLGNDLQAIDNELQKVLISVKERPTVSLEDVRAVVGDFREYASFDLADAVGRKDREKAFLILSRLIQEGEQPVGLLGSLAWNFRRLMRAKSLEAAGTGYDEIKRKLGIIFHQSASFQAQMRSYTLEELRGVFEALLYADRSLKSSGMNGRLILERAILRFCARQE